MDLLLPSPFSLPSVQRHVLGRTGNGGTRGERSNGDLSGFLDTLLEAVERRLDVLDCHGRRRRKGEVEFFKAVNRIG